MNRLSILFSATVIILGNSLVQANGIKPVFQGVYEKVFGDEPLSSYYDSLLRKALADFGVEEVDSIPLKKMNERAENLIGYGLTSFTLTGIWLNEAALQEYDDNSKLFILYHEAAHYALNHHANVLFAVSLMCPLAITALRVQHAILGSWINSSIATICSLAGGYHFYLKPFIRKQEREADVAAVRVLCLRGQASAAQSFADSLYELIKQGYAIHNDEWHDPLHEQYETITNTLVNCSKIDDESLVGKQGVELL